LSDIHRIDDLRRRVQKDPASIAFAQLAEELRRAGELQESIEICRAGLAIHPGYLSARVTLGRALLEINDLEEAKAELEQVLKSAPENLAAIRGLAEILHRQGSLAPALAQYRTALALAKNDPDLQRTVAELAAQVEPKKPAHVVSGLSFEQIQDELLKAVPPPVAPAAVPPAPEPEPTRPLAPDPPAQVASARVPDPVPQPVESGDEAANARAREEIAALEQWLDAIHVSRTQPRP